MIQLTVITLIICTAIVSVFHDSSGLFCHQYTTAYQVSFHH